MGANVGTYDNILLAPTVGAAIAPQNQLTATAASGGAITFVPGSGFTSGIAIGDILTVTVASQITAGNFSYLVSGGNVSNWVLTSSAGNNAVASIFVGVVTSTSGSWTVSIPAFTADTTTTNTATLCSWKGLALVDTYNPPVSLIDQSGSNYSTGATTGFPSFAPTTGGEMVLGVSSSSTASLGAPIKSGWTALTGGSGTSYTAGYYIQPVGNAYQNASAYSVNGTKYGWSTSGSSATAAVLLRPLTTLFPVKNIQGIPATYQIFGGDGAVVASNSMPAASAISLQTNVTTSATCGVTTPNPITVNPATGGSPLYTPSIGDCFVLTFSGIAGPLVSSLSISSANVSNWKLFGFGPGSGNYSGGIYVGMVTSTSGSWDVTFRLAATGSYGGADTEIITLSVWSGVSPIQPVDFNAQAYSPPTTAPTQAFAYLPAFTPNGNGQTIVSVGNGWTDYSGVTIGSPAITNLSTAAALYSGGTKKYAVGYFQQTLASSVAANTTGWLVTPGGNTGATVTTIGLNPVSGGTSISLPAPNGSAWTPGYYYFNFDATHSGT